MGFAVTALDAAAGGIDADVMNVLDAGGSADVIVRMETTADLGGADALTNRVDRLRLVRDLLVGHADSSQAAVRKMLADAGKAYTVLWINNRIAVGDAGPGLIAALAAAPGVAEVELDEKIMLDPIVDPSPGPDVTDTEWGVEKIGAPQVWDLGYTGEGIVVGNIDTGVRYTHEAVSATYRGNLGGGSYDHDYNWWDPSGICATDAPCDNNNHGTHTMGTIVGGDGFGPGDDDIGVAPDATWIAAKGCESRSCSNSALISSAQFMLCPTRTDGSDPDCSKAPHVVNNSWGGGGGDPWYASVLYPLLRAGIIPVFSAGNSGPWCETGGSPGDYPFILSVGATNSADQLAEFSSRGPGSFRLGSQKPTLSAPGQSVRSAVAGSDTAYSSFSGTSMAAPHVAGAIALMLQANPSATYVEIYQALIGTAVENLGNPVGGPDSCGGRSYTEYPNYHYGYGLLNVFAAVSAVTAP
jgi:subtilisin family serine protease